MGKKKKPFIETRVSELKPVLPPIASNIGAIPTVSFNTWSSVSGVKRDQLAAFKSYANKNGIDNLTIPEWKTEFERFLDKPVK